MRIRILRDCDYDVTPAQTLAFRKDTEDNVPREMAEALIARGDAVAVTDPAPAKPAKEA